MYQQPFYNRTRPTEGITDKGGEPYVAALARITRRNRTYRTAIWTGKHLQLTVMSIRPGDDVGPEMHPDVDQMLYIEEGRARVMMGDRRDHLTFRTEAVSGDAILVPAGTWHNVINETRRPLQLFSVYGPPNHPKGTVHETKEIAEQEEHGYGQ